MYTGSQCEMYFLLWVTVQKSFDNAITSKLDKVRNEPVLW